MNPTNTALAVNFNGQLLVISHHAMKRTKKRFHLRSDDDVLTFLSEEVWSPATTIAPNGHRTYIATCPAATIILGASAAVPNALTVITCYPLQSRPAALRGGKIPPAKFHSTQTPRPRGIGRQRTRDYRAAERRALLHLRRVDRLDDIYDHVA